MLVPAIVSITLALVLYTIGVWWERRERVLRGRHVIFFVAGFACDAIGTGLMSVIVSQSGHEANAMSGVHALTGTIAIVLMLFHAVWSIAVLIRDKPSEKEIFHKFSTIVWGIWLIPYALGMVMGMS